MDIRTASVCISLPLWLPALAACGDDTATSGTGSGSSTSSSEATDSFSSSAGEATLPTTGEPQVDLTRGVYLSFDERVHMLAVRGVEIVDGVPQPPFDVLTPPADSRLQGLFQVLDTPPWLPVTASGADPSHFWLVDLATLVPHEVAVPAGSAFGFPRQTGDLSGVILPAAEGAEQAPFFVCVIRPDGDCPLRELDPPLPAGVVLDEVREVSSLREYVVYTTRPEVGAGFDVHFARLDAMDVPVTIASFPSATHLKTELAPDQETLYLEVGVESESLEHFAVDVSSDPPAPPVTLHPPLLGGNLAAVWAPDMSALMLFVGEGEFGDLHHLAVVGATGGPMQLVHAAAPGHAFRSPAEIVRFSPDAARAVYFSDHESPGKAQLYLIDLDAPGAPPVRLGGPLAPGQAVYDARFLPGSGRMVYFTSTLAEPYAGTIAAIELGAPLSARTLNAPGVTSVLNAVHASADGSRIVYSGRAAGEQDNYFFADLSDPESEPVNLTGSLSPSSRPLWAGFSPSGRHFFMDLDSSGSIGGEVVMVPLDPVADAVTLSEPGERAAFFQVLPP